MIARPEKLLKKAGRYIILSLLAAEQAISQANTDNIDPNRIAVVIGAAVGGLPWIEANVLMVERGSPRRISPFYVPGTLPNMPAGYVSQYFGCCGPSLATASAHAIAMASMLLSQGDVDVVVVGGVESTICNSGLGGYSALRALSTNLNPDQASRLGGRHRDGFVIAEGAGVIAMESLSQAQQREASAQGVFSGYGMTSDGYHITTPDPSAEQHVLSKHLALD